jgi:hypothetical protein
MRHYRAIVAAVIASASLTMCQLGYAAEASAFQVSFNTSALIGNAAGPFAIAFVLTNGSGPADGKSTAIVTNVDLEDGKPLGDPATIGGASGELSSVVTLTNTSFLNLLVENFSPGKTLSFQVSVTGERNPGGYPAGLAILILDGSGTPLATLAPAGDYFLSVGLTSEDPFPKVYGSDPSRPPFTGTAISIPAPRIDE